MSSHFYSLDEDEDHDDQPQPNEPGPSHRTRESGSALNGDGGGKRNPISTMLDETSSNPAQSSLRQSPKSSNVIEGFDSWRGKEGKSQVIPIAALQSTWVAERASPDILTWKGDTVDTVCSQIEEQVSIIESLRADASTLEEEHVRLALVELDIERAKWLLRSYLRCRLDKIERFASFLIQSTSNQVNLSELERGYAQKYAEITSQHFTSSILDFLPENMRGLDDRASGATEGRGDMIAAPDFDKPVFIRCKMDCGTIPLSNQDESATLAQGTIHLLRYRAVRHLVERERVELL